MSKLWEKGYAIDETLAQFTVGNDPKLDLEIVFFDCIASIAHAQMLGATGLLTADEAKALSGELSRLARASQAGSFSIALDQEDCHTAIENQLTDRLGDLGKKIHAGRSRNDQVLTAIRLYAKEQLRQCAGMCLGLASGLIRFAEKHQGVALVGRTHMQKAMPSSVGLWAMAFAESLLDDHQQLQAVYTLIDQSPLGSAASYGVEWPIDREMTAAQMGFSKVQNNVLYSANSRGKFEVAILHVLVQIMADLTKLSVDLMFFSLPETGYVKIPQAFCSGSSLMPQKRNPCALELIRAKASTVSSYLSQMLDIIRPLPSGYHRDFQETKGPLINGFTVTKQCVMVMTHLLEHLEIDLEACTSAFAAEVFATDEVMRLTAQGMPFRDAYKYIGQNPHLVELEDANAHILKRRHIGAPGNLGIDSSKKALELAYFWLQSEEEKWKKVVNINLKAYLE